MSPHEFGWGLIAQFEPDAAAHHLVSSERAYAGEREMIFAGLCAWTIAPDDTKLVRTAIDLVGFRGFGNLESGNFRRLGFTKDAAIATHNSTKYRKYLVEFYYPHGGMAAARCHGGGPPYAKCGRRVIYDRAELDAWLAARTRNNTSEMPK